MLNTYLIKGNEILINAPGNAKKNRIKNELVWDINSFLATQFELYALFMCKAPPEFTICRLVSNFPKKYVAFQKLDEMFIKRKVLSDDELSFYREIMDSSRKINDEVFKEMCCVENVDIEYVATESVDQLLNINMQCNHTTLTRRISSLFPVYVSLFGAKEMKILINRSSLLRPIQRIVVAHCVIKV